MQTDTTNAALAIFAANRAQVEHSEAVLEQGAVGEPGQRVVRGQPFELDLIVVAGRDIADRADPGEDLAVRGACRRER